MSNFIRTGKYIFIFLTATLLFLQSCDEKVNNNTSGKNSDLIREANGKTYVNAKYNPELNSKFSYKIIAETSSSDKSPATNNQEMKSRQMMTYYYTQEVESIDNEGIITMKMSFDSIQVLSAAEMNDSTITELYNSNVKDSIYNLPDFIQYNALINQRFYLRIDKTGDILDVYGLEKVYENIYKALGDTLSEQDKSLVKESFGKESIKGIIQNQFQIFPQTEITIDSAWTRSYETNLLVFPVRNNLSYTLLEINEEGDQSILKIKADLGIDFLNKEINEEGAKYTLTKSDASGTGEVLFDLKSGWIVKKNTQTTIEMEAKLSARGQSVTSVQKLTTNLTV